MANITREEILKLAKLARLSLSDEEIGKFQKEIGDILSYADMLSNTDTKGLDPTYQVTGLSNIFRTDDIRDYGADQGELLKNAPDKQDDYFKVRRMIG